MGLLKNIFLLVAVASISVSCARLLPAEPKGQEQIQPDNGNNSNNGGATLVGEFTKPDGTRINFKEFAEKPTIIFFAGEFCAACREETELLVQLFKEKGLPTQINLATVLVGSSHEDIAGWVETFEKGKPDWTIGADSEDNVFYKKYFTKLVTPSILYVNPTSNETKKFQLKISIENLQKETVPWY